MVITIFFLISKNPKIVFKNKFFVEITTAQFQLVTVFQLGAEYCIKMIQAAVTPIFF